MYRVVYIWSGVVCVVWCTHGVSQLVQKREEMLRDVGTRSKPVHNQLHTTIPNGKTVASALEAELSSRTKESSMRRLICGKERLVVFC